MAWEQKSVAPPPRTSVGGGGGGLVPSHAGLLHVSHPRQPDLRRCSLVLSWTLRASKHHPHHPRGAAPADGLLSHSPTRGGSRWFPASAPSARDPLFQRPPGHPPAWPGALVLLRSSGQRPRRSSGRPLSLARPSSSAPGDPSPARGCAGRRAPEPGPAPPARPPLPFAMPPRQPAPLPSSRTSSPRAAPPRPRRPRRHRPAAQDAAAATTNATSGHRGEAGRAEAACHWPSAETLRPRGLLVRRVWGGHRKRP